MDELISRQEAIEALEKFEKQCWKDIKICALDR